MYNAPTPVAAETVISVRQVRKSFRDVHAVAGVDLEIRRGEYVALLGPNGAGKTTLVEMIEGIQKPDGGEIVILGRDWRHGGRELRRRMGIALQETRFTDRLTVGETLDLFASFYGGPTRPVDELLQLLGLAEKRRAWVQNLSGGQKQKLSLGVALVNQPEILILDEPTTGLDPHARRDIWEILQNLQRRETTLILTTHYMEEAEALCERILIMDHGRFLAQGSLRELLEAHGGGGVIDFAFDACCPVTDLPALAGVRGYAWQVPGRKGQLQVEDAAVALPAFAEWARARGVPLRELDYRRLNLNDLFIAMTGRGLDA